METLNERTVAEKPLWLSKKPRAAQLPLVLAYAKGWTEVAPASKVALFHSMSSAIPEHLLKVLFNTPNLSIVGFHRRTSETQEHTSSTRDGDFEYVDTRWVTDNAITDCIMSPHQNFPTPYFPPGVNLVIGTSHKQEINVERSVHPIRNPKGNSTNYVDTPYTDIPYEDVTQYYEPNATEGSPQAYAESNASYTHCGQNYAEDYEHTTTPNGTYLVSCPNECNFYQDIGNQDIGNANSSSSGTYTGTNVYGHPRGETGYTDYAAWYGNPHGAAASSDTNGTQPYAYGRQQGNARKPRKSAKAYGERNNYRSNQRTNHPSNYKGNPRGSNTNAYQGNAYQGSTYSHAQGYDASNGLHGSYGECSSQRYNRYQGTNPGQGFRAKSGGNNRRYAGASHQQHKRHGGPNQQQQRFQQSHHPHQYQGQHRGPNHHRGYGEPRGLGANKGYNGFQGYNDVQWQDRALDNEAYRKAAAPYSPQSYSNVMDYIHHPFPSHFNKAYGAPAPKSYSDPFKTFHKLKANLNEGANGRYNHIDLNCNFDDEKGYDRGHNQGGHGILNQGVHGSHDGYVGFSSGHGNICKTNGSTSSVDQQALVSGNATVTTYHSTTTTNAHNQSTVPQSTVNPSVCNNSSTYGVNNQGTSTCNVWQGTNGGANGETNSPLSSSRYREGVNDSSRPWFRGFDPSIYEVDMTKAKSAYESVYGKAPPNQHSQHPSLYANPQGQGQCLQQSKAYGKAYGQSQAFGQNQTTTNTNLASSPMDISYEEVGNPSSTQSTVQDLSNLGLPPVIVQMMDKAKAVMQVSATPLNSIKSIIQSGKASTTDHTPNNAQTYAQVYHQLNGQNVGLSSGKSSNTSSLAANGLPYAIAPNMGSFSINGMNQANGLGSSGGVNSTGVINSTEGIHSSRGNGIGQGYAVAQGMAGANQGNFSATGIQYADGYGAGAYANAQGMGGKPFINAVYVPSLNEPFGENIAYLRREDFYPSISLPANAIIEELDISPDLGELPVYPARKRIASVNCKSAKALAETKAYASAQNKANTLEPAQVQASDKNQSNASGQTKANASTKPISSEAAGTNAIGNGTGESEVDSGVKARVDIGANTVANAVAKAASIMGSEERAGRGAYRSEVACCELNGNESYVRAGRENNVDSWIMQGGLETTGLSHKGLYQASVWKRANSKSGCGEVLSQESTYYQGMYQRKKFGFLNLLPMVVGLFIRKDIKRLRPPTRNREGEEAEADKPRIKR